LATRRPNYDNVFLEDDTASGGGQSRLIAMDHTHCFTCGGDLNSRIARIDCVKDARLYGLFPGFPPMMNEASVDAAIAKLTRVEKASVQEIVGSIPSDWQVDGAAREAMACLIVERAEFVASTIKGSIKRALSPETLFFQNTPPRRGKGGRKQ
jgi:hypothetical protein